MADIHAHPELQQLRTRLTQIHKALENFKPLMARPPIIDSSFDATNEASDDNQWLHQESIPGLKKLKENIKIDLSVLDKFLDDPNCTSLPPISTNAPYVIAVWNEVLCAPEPIVSIFKTFLLKPSTIVRTSAKERKLAVQQHPPGAKVDIVADNGRRWIRVNTIKNSRLQAEFREIDSYLTDSEEESDEGWDNVERPSLAQTEFDNSVLKMGRSLLEAAKANPIEGTADIPQVTLRLTRLFTQSLNDNGTDPDRRIGQTLESLREMGIDVALGERTESEIPAIESSSSTLPSPSPFPLMPTSNVNLDLSVLIALISDLTHAPLPQSLEEANRRFIPPQEYREWKQKRLAMTGKPQMSHNLSGSDTPIQVMETDINELPRDLIKHAQALTNQLLQEMGKGLLQEMHDRISFATSLYLSNGAYSPSANTPSKAMFKFWTTAEARERCLRIVSKIGGTQEKRRARALFQLGPILDADTDSEEQQISLEDAEQLYWQDSRFPLNFIPLLPIHILAATTPTQGSSSISTSQKTLVVTPELGEHIEKPKSEFGKELTKVCIDILSQETLPHPRALPNVLVMPIVVGTSDLTTSMTSSERQPQPEIQRATVTRANPRLTAHTVQSMQWGAELRWSTLTANRTSVKAILREKKAARVAGRLGGSGSSGKNPDGVNDIRGTEMDEKDGSKVGHGEAAIWIVDPRSLAEGMSSQPSRIQ